MCLTCKQGRMTIEQKTKLFYTDKNVEYKSYLKTIDNQNTRLSPNQISEIIKNALTVIATSVDFTVTVWAIQWANDYETVNF